MSDSLRIVVDRELCNGHGRCVELLPSVFELGEDDISRVRADAAAPTASEIQRVIALCPELAISQVSGP